MGMSDNKDLFVSFLVFVVGLILTALFGLPTMAGTGIIAAEAIRQTLVRAGLSTLVMDNVIAVLSWVGLPLTLIMLAFMIFLLSRKAKAE